MSETPEDLHYASSHEWLRFDKAQGTGTVGISDFAQGELGDVVFVELPVAGSQVKAGQQICVVESVKTASDIYAPVSGEIVEVNSRLTDAPELINASPYEDGWLFRIRVRDAAEVEGLLSAADYQESCESH